VSEPVSERRTARLRLRRVTEADIPAVVAISTDPRTALAIGLVRCPDLDGAGFVAFVG
jgi:hypothetical protein